MKIADLEERNRQEQEELNRRLEEEQKKRQAEQEQEGIIEIPVDRKDTASDKACVGEGQVPSPFLSSRYSVS